MLLDERTGCRIEIVDLGEHELVDEERAHLQKQGRLDAEMGVLHGQRDDRLVLAGDPRRENAATLEPGCITRNVPTADSRGFTSCLCSCPHTTRSNQSGIIDSCTLDLLPRPVSRFCARFRRGPSAAGQARCVCAAARAAASDVRRLRRRGSPMRGADGGGGGGLAHLGGGRGIEKNLSRSSLSAGRRKVTFLLVPHPVEPLVTHVSEPVDRDERAAFLDEHGRELDAVDLVVPPEVVDQVGHAEQVEGRERVLAALARRVVVIAVDREDGERDRWNGSS